MEYITNPKKAVIVSSLSMDDSREYAKQFKETCDLYGKGDKYGERKYYHFKLSPNPTDYPSPQQVHELAEQMAQKLFSAHECVIATHLDTDATHSHIVVNSVSFETGKKLHICLSEYGAYKDLADIVGEELGFTPLNWRTKTAEKRERLSADKTAITENKHLSQAERHIAKRDDNGVASWKEVLRQAIDEAKACCTDRAEFQTYLKEVYDIDMPRNTAKTISFVHPAVGETYAVRGAKLGADYTAENIDRALAENKERSVENARLFTSKEEYSTTDRNDSTIATISNRAIIPSKPTTQTGNGECLTPRSISDIITELREIDGAVQSVIKGSNQIMEKSQSNGERNTKSDTGQQQESHKSTETVRKHEPSVQQKPTRRSKSYER